jgi:hypothetical protein
LIGGSIKESSGGKVWMTLKEGEGVDWGESIDSCDPLSSDISSSLCSFNRRVTDILEAILLCLPELERIGFGLVRRTGRCCCCRCCCFIVSRLVVLIRFCCDALLVEIFFGSSKRHP